MNFKATAILAIATSMFATASWAGKFSDAAEELKTKNYGELKEIYTSAGYDGEWIAPGPSPLGEEAEGAAAFTMTIGNSLFRRVAYPLTYATSWKGKRFFKEEGSCNVEKSNSSFTINNKVGFFFLPLTWGSGPADFYLRDGTISWDDNNTPTWYVNYTRKSPQVWYLVDELRLIDYQHDIDQGTWMGFMMARPIPGLDRLNMVTATWIIDRIGAADCLKDRFFN